MNTDTPLEEETLIAFVDGELTPSEADRVAKAQARDPEVAARIEALRRTADLIKNTYAPVGEAAPPQSLIDAVTRLSQDHDAAARPAVQRRAGLAAQVMESIRRSLRPANVWLAPAGAAAGLALGFFLFAGETGQPFSLDGGQTFAAGRLAAALDRQPSGESADGVTTIQLSFDAQDGRTCRSFLHEQTAGLACRQDSGWRLERLASVQGQEAHAFRTAGAAMPADLLETIDRLIEGEPLDRTEEAARIADQWRRSASSEGLSTNAGGGR